MVLTAEVKRTKSFLHDQCKHCRWGGKRTCQSSYCFTKHSLCFAITLFGECSALFSVCVYPSCCCGDFSSSSWVCMCVPSHTKLSIMSKKMTISRGHKCSLAILANLHLQLCLHLQLWYSVILITLYMMVLAWGEFWSSCCSMLPYRIEKCSWT